MSARILERVTVYKAADHYCNQAIVATLSSGELVCVSSTRSSPAGTPTTATSA